MPDSQASLEELVSKAVEETPPADAEQPPSSQDEGKEESASSASEEAGESLTPNLRRIRESLKGDEEFQKLPPESQTLILKRMAEGDKAFHKDKAFLADWKRKAEVYDTLEQAGVTTEKLQRWIERERKGEEVPATVEREATKALRGLDRLMAKAERVEDPAQRAIQLEQIRELREVLKEELEVLVDSHPRTKALEQEVRSLRVGTQAKRLNGLNAEIDKLEAKYPSSLIEKYRANLKTLAVRPENAQVSVRKLLTILASDEELEEAETFMGKPTGEVPPKKPTGTSSVTTPSVDEKELAPYKEKKGGWDLRGLIEHVVPKTLKL